MKSFSLILAVLFSFNVISQSLDEANSWFANYEYARAAQIFSDYAKNKPLPFEDYKRMGYAYFIIGDFENCLPVMDSVIKTKNAEPFFIFMHGEASMGMGLYDQAKTSFITYQKLDNEYNVSNKIASCDLISSWSPIVHISNKMAFGNSTKADISGSTDRNGVIYYKELGKDSLEGSLHQGDVDISELLLMRPFVEKESGSKDQLTISTEIPNASVNSITIGQNSSEAIITITRPTAQLESDQAPHLYTATFNRKSNSLETIKLWAFSGYEDSTSCAHATFNASENLVVFTKMGSRTNGADLYVSRLVEGVWSKPTALTSLNTELDEMFPMFMGDTLLSFSSDGRPGYGGLDIYLAKVKNGEFSAIEHLKSPINSFTDDFNFVYYSADSARYTSNRKGGMGDDDIYFIKFKEREISAQPDSLDFDHFVGTWKQPTIYFDFDAFDLKKDIDLLEELIPFLAKYENSTITIEGHTDRRGSENYNLNLGYARANRVKNELVSKGIRPNQIHVVSKGESDPQFNYPNDCTEAQHALNRVALVKLLAK